MFLLSTGSQAFLSLETHKKSFPPFLLCIKLQVYLQLCPMKKHLSPDFLSHKHMELHQRNISCPSNWVQNVWIEKDILWLVLCVHAKSSLITLSLRQKLSDNSAYLLQEAKPMNINFLFWKTEGIVLHNNLCFKNISNPTLSLTAFVDGSQANHFCTEK